MKPSEHHFQELREKIKKTSDDIHELQKQNESAKRQIITILKENNRIDFTEQAENFLELLLHTERVIEMLRHDFSEFALLANSDELINNLESRIQKLQSIENDVFKTAKLIEQVQRAISGH